MLDAISPRVDALSPTSCRVYKNSPDYTRYLSSRFAVPNTSVFKLSGQMWVYSHSSSDGKGMFDVLYLANDDATGGYDARESNHERFMRDRTELPDFFHINVPMSVLRSLLPPVLTSGIWAGRTDRL